MRFTKIFTWIRIPYDGKENIFGKEMTEVQGAVLSLKRGRNAALETNTPPPPPTTPLQAL